MDKCRVCLNSRKTIYSLFESNNGTSYVNMITSIANVKINKGDGITDKICRFCCRHLKEAYEFKLLIERSDAVLCEDVNLKRINYSNFNDVKIQIEIESLLDSKRVIPKCEDISEYFNSGTKEISYMNTVIKKMDTNEADNNTKAVPVMEFLQTINEHQDFASDYDMENYDLDNCDWSSVNEDLPIADLMKTRTMRKYRKDMLKSKQNENNQILEKPKRKRAITEPMKPVCIKPTYLHDIMLIRNHVKNETDKSKREKRKYQSKTQMCAHCGILTKSLKTHVLTHTGEKKFKCDECEKAFYKSNALLRHQETHRGIRNFQCEHCVATFVNKGSLKSHMLMHTEEKRHVCDICKKAFKRRSALLRHSMMHSSANKIVKCDLCNMSFYTKFGLRHHLRVHTGERPYNCEICSQPYSYKHDFNRHCLKKHGVFLKRRSVYVMNEEILKQEKILMRNLMLRVSGIIKDDKPLNPFEGPQAALAFEQAVKALENRQIPIDYHL